MENNKKNMRIISGKLKGKKLSFLNTPNTRPLRDFVKENIFNIIYHSNLINIKIKDATVLDLYSGIGSFGIECISREASAVTFVEKDKNTLNYLNKNIKALLIEDKISLFKGDTSQFLKQKKGKKYDVIFLDPPYTEIDYLNDLKIINNLDILNKKHLIIIHREKNSKEKLEKLIDIKIIKYYGRSKVIFGCLF